MLSTVLTLSLKSIDHLAAARRKPARDRHPLAAYPRLHSLIIEAERSGSLAAERRRLLQRLAA